MSPIGDLKSYSHLLTILKFLNLKYKIVHSNISINNIIINCILSAISSNHSPVLEDGTNKNIPTYGVSIDYDYF